MLFVAFLPAAGLPLQAQSLLTDDLETAIREQPREYFKVYLLLADQVDVRALQMEWDASRKPHSERAAILLPLLREKAAQTQAPLLEDLRRMSGVKPQSIQPFWAINAIFLEATQPALQILSRRKDLKQIGLDMPVYVHELEANCQAPLLPASPDGIEPGLAAINAPRMWREGYTGYGRKGYVIDTGQDPEHPALRNQFAFQNFSLAEVWAGTGQADYCDSHGSHVTGSMVGLDRINRDTIGVAFNGMWLGGPSNLGGFSDCVSNPNPTFQNTIFNLQWALDPDGNPSTTDDVPDVINNSWGGGQTCGQSQSVYNPLFVSFDALGIAVIFSAGNAGPGSGTVSAPGHLSLDDINIFTVGNINAGNSSFPINPSSSRGPSPCDGSIKPEVVAPGTNVRSAVPGGYTQFRGTSMASPHVAGAVLLLKEAFPNLPGKTLLDALYRTATDLGADGEDNNYGRGIIDVWAAYLYLIQEGNAPAPPASTARDLVLLDVQYPLVNCAGEVQPRILLENGGQSPVNSFSYTFVPGGLPTGSGQLNLEAPLLPGERRQIALPPFSVPVNGEREVRLSVSNPNGQTDARSLNNGLKAQIVVDDVVPPQASLAAGSQVCSGSQVRVRSSFEGEGTVRWYDERTGGNLLAEGRDAVVEVPADADRFSVFAETTVPGKVGKDDPAVAAFFDNDDRGLEFDAHAPFTLRSVVVIAEEPGNRIIRLRRPDGGAINRIISVPGTGEQRIELDLDIEPGEGYELLLFMGGALQFNLGAGVTDFPYEIPNVVSITRSTNGSSFYNYFYDWEITYADPCGRVELDVPVNTGSTAPTAAFTASADTVNLAEGGQITFTDASEGAASWSWDFGDGNTSTAQNPTHTFTGVGTFTVYLTTENGEGCTDVAQTTITVVNISAIRELNALDAFVRVYPNPTTGKVQVDIQKPLHGQPSLRVVDMLGRQVLPERLLGSGRQQVNLDLGTLPGGTYTLILQSADGRAVKRVLRM